ncbi:trigger factor [Agarilytica rhodophyticola]|uniref:trigger factor n=1 Tax=Agarilytica rhodophyticola TaxID=1737490 RepID=UPI000B3496CA|nr:trigger factor [Agarilytica rhodophyticola]
MQVSIETISGLERRLTIGVPADVVDQEVTKRLNKAAKTVRINGFRKGKVPLKVVKQRFGEGVRQEVLGDTINRTFYEAVQKESVRPAGQPTIEPKNMEEGSDLEYIATFEVYPEVELTNIEGIEVTKYDADIEDKDIDKMIENLRKGQATWNNTKAAIKDGFKVKIDFSGVKDGEAFEGGSAEDHELVIGSKSMIPGFEDGIIGMKIGETKDVEVTFPEDYQVESLKGADATFTITLKSAEKQVLPKLDEAFFEKFGVTEGGEEKFREDVKENMEREKQKAIKNKTKQQILDSLLDRTPVEVPNALVAGEIDALRNQTIQQYGGAAENLDMKALLPDDMFKEQAQRRTALGLIVSEIVTQEKITADKDVVRSLIEEAAASYESPEEVVNYYYSNEQLLQSVEAAALEEQVVDFLLEKAEVTEAKVAYDEALKPLPQPQADDQEGDGSETKGEE